MARLAIVRADSIGEGNGRSWKKKITTEKSNVAIYERHGHGKKKKTQSLKHDLTSRLPRILARSRRSDGKARRSDGGERVKSYAGKTREKPNGVSPGSLFPRQLFARTLSSERLEHADRIPVGRSNH